MNWWNHKVVDLDHCSAWAQGVWTVSSSSWSTLPVTSSMPETFKDIWASVNSSFQADLTEQKKELRNPQQSDVLELILGLQTETAHSRSFIMEIVLSRLLGYSKKVHAVPEHIYTHTHTQKNLNISLN